MSPANNEIIDLFPRSADLPDSFSRAEGLLQLQRVAMAARAAVDEITVRTPDFATDDRFIVDALAEQLHHKVDEVKDLLDK